MIIYEVDNVRSASEDTEGVGEEGGKATEDGWAETKNGLEKTHETGDKAQPKVLWAGMGELELERSR